MTTTIRTAQGAQITSALGFFETYFAPYLAREQHLSISCRQNEVEIDIHGTQPEIIVQLAADFDAEPHTDGDGIARWVEIEREAEGVTVTFYRR